LWNTWQRYVIGDFSKAITPCQKQNTTTMDYYESAIGEMITKQRAFFELEKHGIDDYDEFLNDVGDKLEYLATDVLDWLGY